MKTSGIIDTRDLAKRKDELEGLRDELEEARRDRAAADSDEAIEIADASVESAQDAFGEEEAKELDALEVLESEVTEWSDGNALVPESEFTDYVRDMLEDCGDIPRDIPHYIVIDWEATADNVRVDYSEVEFQGVTYLYLA